MTYQEKLKDPRWQKKRLKVLKRDNWCCRICLDTETTLHVHHLKYTKEPWDAPLKDLETLCEECHKNIKWLKEWDDNLSTFDSVPISKLDGYYQIIHQDGFVFFDFNGRLIMKLSAPRIKAMHALTDREYRETMYTEKLV